MDDSEHWIDRALRNHKKKATHKMLGLPLEQPLPLYLLEEIKQAPIGALVRYSYMGKFGVVRRLLHRNPADEASCRTGFDSYQVRA